MNNFKSTYSEKLKDPRWQKKRLEVFQRDKFSCRGCASTDKTLHVHHGYYEDGKEPWEYPNHAFYTLCEDCHEEETYCIRENPQHFIQSLKQAGLTAFNFHKFTELMYKINSNTQLREAFIKKVVKSDFKEFIKYLKKK